MADKNKGGRPTNYKSEYAEQAYKICLLGATDKDLAMFFDVSEQTINSWKDKQPEFLESLKRGKTIADAEIASKLYHRAKGYEHEDTQFATFQGEITDRETYIKHYPPDTTAAIFWLKNRQPDKWRDKQDIESKNTNENTNYNYEMDAKRFLSNATAAEKQKYEQGLMTDREIAEIIGRK